MFIILLKFSKNKGKAQEFMKGHMKWIQQGFDDGVFLLTGSIKPSLGGAVMAHKTTLSDLKKRIDADPFVSENVVEAEILEIDPSKSDQRLEFLNG
ncbi:YciI family protein [Bdellovibrio bacteriovorus]|uniref:YciI family protein n=1 Tax=Bdellovibrio TaxID=958 RepID=UPI0035A98E2F